ncbi:MAG TPA: calcium-binding protein, partial [Chroococcidiopsis sp.]
GGAGIDQLNGGLGDDTYFVDHINDRVIEAANQGVDAISTQVDYSLVNAPQVENLLLEGIALSGTGNALNNVIGGNSLDNTISGGDGDDGLVGDNGADTLLGEAGSDVLAGQGGNDTLVGGTGDDGLVGGIGTDTLTGGLGADVFFFDLGTAFTTTEIAGNDVISDFEINVDAIVLDKDTFTALTSSVGRGFNISSEFSVVANDLFVPTSNARIIYSQGSGRLFYKTGVFGETAQLFATLSTKPTLVAANFAILD